MTHIEDEYKKRFNNQELSNDDFDSEGFWDTISENLDLDEPKDKKKKRIIWFWFLFFGVAMISGITYYFNSNKQGIVQKPVIENRQDKEIEKNQLERSTSASNGYVSPSKESISKNNKTINPENPPSIEETITIDQLTKNSRKENTTDKTSSNPKSTLENNGVAKPKVFDLPKNIDSNRNLVAQSKNGKEKSETTQESQTTDQPYQPNQPEVNTSNSSPTESSQITAIDSSSQVTEPSPASQTVELDTSSQSIALDTSTQNTVLDTLAQTNFPIPENKTQENKDARNISWEVGAWGGSNLINFNYKSSSSLDLAKINEQSESGELGLSLGFNTALIWKEHWLLNTGFEYHQLWSRFEYESMESSQELKENQLLKVWVDETTGDTLNRFYGDINVNSITTREVVHFNKFQRFSIPIEIGFQKSAQKLVYGISAGGVLNFTFNQAGRTLDKNTEIKEFDNDSSVAPFKPFSLGLRVCPFVGYRISKNLTMKIQPQWSLVSSSKFDGTDIKLNAHQFNLNLGLGYSFD